MSGGFLRMCSVDYSECRVTTTTKLSCMRYLCDRVLWKQVGRGMAGLPSLVLAVLRPLLLLKVY